MTVTTDLDVFQPGRQFRSGERAMHADRIKAFAAEFDPQPQHLDEVQAAASQFGGLVASGWHTASLVMRLFVDSLPPMPGGAMGTGVDELRWLRPVRPGDVLYSVATVTAARRSASQPDKDVVTCEVAAMNRRDEPVLRFLTTMLVSRPADIASDV